jgi:ribose transport system substrate-binding protein
MQKRRMATSRRARIAAVLTLAFVVGACAAAPASPTPDGSATIDPSGPASPTAAAPAASARAYRIGVSNAQVGDGWRTEMICSIKAQAKVSGRVARLQLADRTTDASGQAADIADLVTAGVDAIVLVPSDPTAIKDAVAAAVEAGVKVVSIGQPVDVEGVQSIATDEGAYGELGARWLFAQLGGKGDVVVLRGRKGDPVDAARDAGFQRALAAYPDIKVVSEMPTGGDPVTAVQQLNGFLADGKTFDGIWTGGLDRVVVDALKIAQQPFVPIVGGDRGSFVSQLLTEEGLVGAAVTDSPAVGGAALELAIAALDGDAAQPAAVVVRPEVWPNDTDAGKAALSEANDPDLDFDWPLSTTIPGRTTYTDDELMACDGPEA